MIFIVAEAGINHGGVYSAAVKLCDEAKAAHADAVKFQYFSSQKLWGDDRITHLELGQAEFVNLSWHCKDIGIELIVTPFDADGVAFVTSLGVKRMKVASGCINRKPLLNAIRDTELPVILSTGMSELPDITNALIELGNHLPCFYGKRPITLLHCTSTYPCPMEEVNLKAMNVLRSQWGDRCEIGFSDHTENGVCAIAAAAMGATVIEKHLTLDRAQVGPDHKASIEPMTFFMMVQAIRQVEKSMGDGIKRVMPGEMELRKAWGRD